MLSSPARAVRELPSGRRRGAALLEFALVVFTFYLLAAGIITFGHMIYTAQIVQQAADAGAQEIARMPLPPTISFGQSSSDPGTVLNRPDFKAQIYDEKFLVVPVGNLTNGQSLTDYFANKPLINRLLAPALIFDVDANAYRYPGALVKNAAGDQTVLIPVVTSRNSTTGAETLQWSFVLEEIQADRDDNNKPIAPVGPFSVSATPASPLASFVPGTVALRINYPYQAAMMSGFQPSTPTATDPLPPNVNNVIEADDASVQAGALPSGYTLQVTANQGSGPVSGEFGLGKQFSSLPLARGSKTTTVRPYRKLISAQGIYRREVFGP